MLDVQGARNNSRMSMAKVETAEPVTKKRKYKKRKKVAKKVARRKRRAKRSKQPSAFEAILNDNSLKDNQKINVLKAFYNT